MPQESIANTINRKNNLKLPQILNLRQKLQRQYEQDQKFNSEAHDSFITET